jgi:hypothetical protein
MLSVLGSSSGRSWTNCHSAVKQDIRLLQTTALRLFSLSIRGRFCVGQRGNVYMDYASSNHTGIERRDVLPGGSPLLLTAAVIGETISDALGLCR